MGLIIVPINAETLQVIFSGVPDPAVANVSNWFFAPTTYYPVPLTALSVTYPYAGDLLQAQVTVQGMTSIWYQGQVTTPGPVIWDDIFMGLGDLAQDVFWTRKGPLVKDWGDETPATVKDVHVYVGISQTEVEITDVNPYTGRVQTAIPIPLLPSGDPNGLVTVDYRWIATPIMELSGLNTEGLVLNKWDRSGRAARSGQFPMAVVLPQRHRPDPLLIGWRFMGFERAASALLNAPTTLTLNQNPAADCVPVFTRNQLSSSGSFEATSAPADANSPWILTGLDSGYPVLSGEFVGTYVLEDAHSGIYDPEGTNLFIAKYTQPVQLHDLDPEGVSGYLTVRFEILDYELDGVFTGIGFGLCGNAKFGLIGAVLINGLQHIGWLTDIARPDLETSWILGPQVQGTILTPTSPEFSNNRVSVTTSEIPVGLSSGSRFQILDGVQSGVYTIISATGHTDRTTTLLVTPDFSTRPGLVGTKYPLLVFETPWQGTPSTYRLAIDPDDQAVTLWMAGSVSMPGGRPILNMEADAAWVLQAEDSPVFGMSEDGVFWGSLSFAATNNSRWSFVRYHIVPHVPRFRAVSLNRNALNVTDSVLDDGFAWFARFGYSWWKASDLVIQSSGSTYLNGFNSPSTFTAELPEIFLDRQTNFDLTTEFIQEFTSLGCSPIIEFADPERLMWFGTLSYVAKVSPGLDYRRLVSPPSASMEGFALPTDAGGWFAMPATLTSGITITQLNGQEISYTGDIDDPEAINPNSPVGRVFFAVLQVTAVISGEDALAPFYFGADVGRDAHLRVRFKDALESSERKIMLTTLSDTPVQEVLFDWNDSAAHTYQLVANGTGAIRLTVDGEPLGSAVQAETCPGHRGDFLHDRYEYGTFAIRGSKSVTIWDDIGYETTSPVDPLGPDVRITQSENQRLVYRAFVHGSYNDVVDDGGRVLTARLAITDAELVADLTSVFVAADVHPVSGHVQIRFGGSTNPHVDLTDITGIVAGSYSFDWTDGEPHTYQVKVTNLGVVSLLIDDNLQIPTLTLASFPGRASPTTEDVCDFGTLGDPSWTSISLWQFVNLITLPGSEVLKTVGIYRGNTFDTLMDIDCWELPRADSSTAANSSDDISVDIREVDWSVRQDYRILRTPEWGVTVFIPSLGSAPWHVGKRQGWVNPKSEPSAGWINVEYEDLLPNWDQIPSHVRFGSSETALQRWSQFRYRLFRPQDPDLIAPPSMVLNRGNMLTSGDLGKDTSLEIVAIQSLDTRRVTLKSTHIYAQSVYKIIDGTKIITRESWDFDKKAQLITLKDPIYQPTGGTAEFSSEHANLTVVFIPGLPVTETYLTNQALLESALLLNERTPPFQKDQFGKSVLTVKEIVTATDVTHVDLTPTGNPASQVIRIEDGAQIFVSADYQATFAPPVQPPVPADFTFDPGTQIVTLASGRSFSDPAASLMVWYTPVAINVENGDPTAAHIDPPGTRFRDLKFITVDNDGDTDLITTVSDCTLPLGQSGFIPGEGGDPVYSLTGTGDPLGAAHPYDGLRDTKTTVGAPVGSLVFEYRGSLFNEQNPIVETARVTFDLMKPDGTPITRWERLDNRPIQQLVSGVFLFASGGSTDGGFLNDAALY